MQMTINSLPADKEMLDEIAMHSNNPLLGEIANLAKRVIDAEEALTQDPENHALIVARNQAQNGLINGLSYNLKDKDMDFFVADLAEAKAKAEESLRYESIDSPSASQNFAGMGVIEGRPPEGVESVLASHVAALDTHQIDVLLERVQEHATELGIDIDMQHIDTPREIADIMNNIGMDLSALQSVTYDEQEYGHSDIAAQQVAMSEQRMQEQAQAAALG